MQFLQLFAFYYILDEMLVLLLAILGLCIGSFLNVCIDRLGNEEERRRWGDGESERWGGKEEGIGRLGGRSHCDYCHKQLHWNDLIPVVSYILLGGRCRYCHKKLSLQYPFIEILTSVSFVLVYLFSPHLLLLSSPPLALPIPPSSPLLLISILGIISSSIVIFFSDLKYHIIPDEATVVLILSSLLFHLSTSQSLDLHLSTSPLLHILLSSITAAISLSLTLYFIFYVTKGRGMGFGDVKLAVAIGLLLGLKSGFFALYLAFVAGGVVSLLLILMKRKKLRSKLAFGPFLIFGTLVMFFANKPIIAFFDRLFGM